jgi:predicted transcriptional regulator
MTISGARRRCQTDVVDAGNEGNVQRREPGELEDAVLRAIQRFDQPVAVADIVDVLPGRPAYTTVMTTMSRLADKGALTRVREGRAYRYRMAAPVEAVGDAVTARAMRRLLSDGADRAGVLARFVAELDPDEERVLADLLERKER